MYQDSQGSRIKDRTKTSREVRSQVATVCEPVHRDTTDRYCHPTLLTHGHFVSKVQVQRKAAPCLG